MKFKMARFKINLIIIDNQTTLEGNSYEFWLPSLSDTVLKVKEKKKKYRIELRDQSGNLSSISKCMLTGGKSGSEHQHVIATNLNYAPQKQEKELDIPENLSEDVKKGLQRILAEGGKELDERSLANGEIDLRATVHDILNLITMADLQARHDDQIMETEKAHQEEIENLDRTWKRILDDVKTPYQIGMKNLRDQVQVITNKYILQTLGQEDKMMDRMEEILEISQNNGEKSAKSKKG